MGVKTTLAGLAFTNGGKINAADQGVDPAAMIASCELKCAEAIAALNYLVNDVLTPSGTEAPRTSRQSIR